MSGIFQTHIIANAKELGLVRHSQTYKPAGITLGCSPEVGKGFFWTYCSASSPFALTVMDITVEGLGSWCYRYPGYCAINALYDTPAFDAWRACYAAHMEIDPLSLQTSAARTRGNTIRLIGYQEGGGSFRCPLPQGTRVRGMGITFTPEYLDKAPTYFHIERELIEQACFSGSRVPFGPASTLAMEQLFAASPSSLTAPSYYESKVQELISLAVEEYLARKGERANGSLDPDAAGADRAVELIHEHYAEPLQLSDLERAAAMGRTKLSQTFRLRYGISPMGYLRQVRLEHACLLLADADISIEHVAQAVGYHDPDAFSSRFKKDTGLSPTEYRQTLRV